MLCVVRPYNNFCVMKNMKLSNKDVPAEAVLKQVLIENGQLKSEIDYLKNELENRDKAIAAFKVWQSRVAKYNVDYWLNEGYKLVGEPIDEERVKHIRSLVLKHRLFQTRLDTLEKTLNSYIKQQECVAQELSSLEC